MAHCNTPRKKLRLRELKLNGKEENKVAQKFQVSNKEKVCQACLYKIMKYVEYTKTDDTSKRECMNLNMLEHKPMNAIADKRLEEVGMNTEED